MNEKTVGMLSKFTGVSVHTIKYYEKLGLISSSRREQSNYRSYDVKSCTDEYFKGDLSAFSWGHGISIDTDNDFMKDKKGFEKISGGRMFTAYLCLGGHYASEGDLINEFLRYYNEYKSGIPKAPVYGFRLRITLDETGERKDYFRMQLPL